MAPSMRPKATMFIGSSRALSRDQIARPLCSAATPPVKFV